MDDPALPNREEGRSLLIVEDNDRFADTLASEFRDRGYAVQRAANLASISAIQDLAVQFADVHFAEEILAKGRNARNRQRARRVQFGGAVGEISQTGSVIAERPDLVAAIVGEEISALQI